MFEIWNITPEGLLKSNHNVYNYQFTTQEEALAALNHQNKIQLQFDPDLRMTYEIRKVETRSEESI